MSEMPIGGKATMNICENGCCAVIKVVKDKGEKLEYNDILGAVIWGKETLQTKLQNVSGKKDKSEVSPHH